MRQSIETTLKQLVSIPSISADAAACHAVLNFVKNEIETYGLFIHSQTDIPNPWLIATTQNTLTPDILLVAHLDVVPAPAELFTVEDRDGKLYGRGVYDMKFAAACYLELLKNHADKLPSLNIGFLFTTDEERDSACMPDILATGLRPNVAFIPDGGDDWTIEGRAKGFYGVELVAHGKTAHGSRPWEGKSALHAILDVVQLLRDRYPFINKEEATLTVNGIHSGKAVNQIPDHASALLDFRCFDNQQLHDYRQFVTELAKSNNMEIHGRQYGEALQFDDTAPSVQPFLRALREELGVDKLPFSDSYGGTDARFFAMHAIPSIIIQPHGGGRHSDDEWLKADDLSRYYRLLERWIMADTAVLAPAASQYQVA